MLKGIRGKLSKCIHNTAFCDASDDGWKVRGLKCKCYLQGPIVLKTSTLSGSSAEVEVEPKQQEFIVHENEFPFIHFGASKKH